MSGKEEHHDEGSLMPPLGVIRSLWAFVIGMESTLLAVYTGIALTQKAGLYEAILGAIGGAFFLYFGLSFILQVILKLPGCEMAVIPHLLLGKPMHRCAQIIHEIDRMERDRGLSLSLLTTKTFMIGIFSGMFLFTVLVVAIALGIMPASTSGGLAVLFTLSGVLLRRRRMLSSYRHSRQTISANVSYASERTS